MWPLAVKSWPPGRHSLGVEAPRYGAEALRLAVQAPSVVQALRSVGEPRQFAAQALWFAAWAPRVSEEEMGRHSRARAEAP